MFQKMLQVGNGGGSSASGEILYDANGNYTALSQNTTYPILSDNYDNYKLLEIHYGTYISNIAIPENRSIAFVYTDEITGSASDFLLSLFATGSAFSNVTITFVNGNSLKTQFVNKAGWNAICVHKIVGYK